MRILTNSSLFYIEKAPPLTPAAPLVPSAITKAAPPELTIDPLTGVTKGDIVWYSSTGFPELDDKYGVVGEVTGTTLEAAGFDTTNATATLGANPEVHTVAAADMVRLCIESITIGESSIGEIDLSDFCNPSLTMPGKETLGTVAFHGWVDDEQKATVEAFRLAADDKQPRWFEILSADGKVALVGQIAIGSLSWGVARDSGFEFNVSGTQAKKIDLTFIA